MPSTVALGGHIDHMRCEGSVVGDAATDIEALERSFARGLESLWLAFQPIVRARDGGVFGWEALVRTSEPTLAQASAVVGAAETLERLLDLGRAVRAQAAMQIEKVKPNGRVFLNLDLRELYDPMLTAHDGPLLHLASNVVLEITERAVVEPSPMLYRRLAELREAGYLIALDDLGSGNASLASLVHILPDIIKLDRVLVRDIGAAPVQQKLIRALAAFARDCGCMVVGEGVETEEERDVLASLGCDLLQGFLVGPPGRNMDESVAAHGGITPPRAACELR